MRRLLALLTVVALVTGCSGTATTGPSAPGSPGGSPMATTAPSSPSSTSSAAPGSSASAAGGSASAAPSSTGTPTPTQCATALVDDMSLAERAGQLVMVGVTDAGASELKALRTHHIGSVILMGTRSNGVAGVKKVTARLTWKGQKIPLLVAADQEGGTVQRLKGPGFDTIPAAEVQATWSNATLQARATAWGRQLAAAGVNWTLAPVADVVPSGMSNRNEPIGVLRRGYGPDPATVAAKVSSFVRGMRVAGVATSVKHFPGIGRVVGNTDFAAGVQDTVTTRDDAFLRPFRAAIESGVSSVMLSTVTYTRIDADHPAAFSATVLGMARGMGFDGVLISDDLGAARSVQAVPARQRAVRFVQAGGDVSLTASPLLADEFVEGIVAAAQKSRQVATSVHRSAVRVLTLKIEQGLVPCR